jgi:hypothetical protein
VPWPYLFKRPFPFVLVATQPCHDLSSCLVEVGKKFGRHAFAVDDDALQLPLVCRLFIAAEHLRYPHRQVLVAPVRGCQERMPFLIV